MKNAHERFGWLEFEKQLKDTRTRLRVAPRLGSSANLPRIRKLRVLAISFLQCSGTYRRYRRRCWAGLAGQEWSDPFLVQTSLNEG